MLKKNERFLRLSEKIRTQSAIKEKGLGIKRYTD